MFRCWRYSPVPPVLRFIQQQAGHDDRQAYGTLNMGAGFALFVAAEQAVRTTTIARALGVEAVVAGRVEAGPKQLVIEPLDVTFGSDDLRVR